MERVVPLIFPAFKLAKEAKPVEERVAPVMLAEVRLAKIAKLVVERVVSVVAPAFTPPKEESPETPKVELAVNVVTVVAPVLICPI